MKDNKNISVMLTIGSIATALGINQRTLRIYDSEGILSPKRSEKNRRYYTLEDLEKAKLIQFLTRNLLLNLSGVKIVLAILEQEKIKPENWISYIEKIAQKANITNKIQSENILKADKRGRPLANS